MLKFNNSIVPNKVRIGWHFSLNKYAYRDVYSALKSGQNIGHLPIITIIISDCWYHQADGTIRSTLVTAGSIKQMVPSGLH